jgi:hypothetical protein
MWHGKGGAKLNEDVMYPNIKQHAAYARKYNLISNQCSNSQVGDIHKAWMWPGWNWQEVYKKFDTFGLIIVRIIKTPSLLY